MGKWHQILKYSVNSLPVTLQRPDVAFGQFRHELKPFFFNGKTPAPCDYVVLATRHYARARLRA